MENNLHQQHWLKNNTNLASILVEKKGEDVEALRILGEEGGGKLEIIKLKRRHCSGMEVTVFDAIMIDTIDSYNVT